MRTRASRCAKRIDACAAFTGDDDEWHAPFGSSGCCGGGSDGGGGSGDGSDDDDDDDDDDDEDEEEGDAECALLFPDIVIVTTKTKK